MVKKLKNLIVVPLALAIVFNISNFTETVYANDEIQMIVDGREVEFDVPPAVYNNRVFIPIRALLENVDNYMTWDESVGEKSHYEKEVVMTWDKSYRTINYISGYSNNYTHFVVINVDTGEVYSELNLLKEGTENYSFEGRTTLNPTPVIVDNRTLMPVRAVAESYGYDVDWDGDTRTVYVNSSNPIIANVNTGAEIDIYKVLGESKEGGNTGTVTEPEPPQPTTQVPNGLPTEPPQVGSVLADIVANPIEGKVHYDSGYDMTENYMGGWLGQCTWYATGRSKEVHGMSIGNPNYFGAIKDWVDNAKRVDIYTPSGYSPMDFSLVEGINDPNEIYAGAVVTYSNTLSSTGADHVAFVEYVERDSDGNPTYVYFTDANGVETLNQDQYDHGYDGQVQKVTMEEFISPYGLKFEGYVVPKYIIEMNK